MIVVLPAGTDAVLLSVVLVVGRIQNLILTWTNNRPAAFHSAAISYATNSNSATEMKRNRVAAQAIQRKSVPSV